MTVNKDVPTFPLHTVIMPGGKLELQIFEQRYLEMIKQCLKEQRSFLVVLIKSGAEVGDTPDIYSSGVLVTIVDFYQLKNGLLGIQIQAAEKVRIETTSIAAGGLMLAETDALAPEIDVVLPDEYFELAELLRQLIMHPSIDKLHLLIDYESAVCVSSRLVEWLPLEREVKQELFELSDPLSRLERIDEEVQRMQGYLDA